MTGSPKQYSDNRRVFQELNLKTEQCVTGTISLQSYNLKKLYQLKSFAIFSLQPGNSLDKMGKYYHIGSRNGLFVVSEKIEARFRKTGLTKGKKMNNNKTLICTLLLLLLSTLFCTAQEANEKTWDEFFSKVNKVWEEEKLADAIALLEKEKYTYPEKLPLVLNYLGDLYINTDQADKAIEAWAEGNKKGYFFWMLPYQEQISKMADNPKFKKFAAENAKIGKEVNAKLKPEYEVVTPENYDKTKKYPIIIFCHGGGQSIKKCKTRWVSERMYKGRLVAFLQSGKMTSTDQYRWDLRGTALDEVKGLVEKIKSQYLVDESNIIIAGFSQGAYIALKVVQAQTFPVTGFIAGCPPGGPEISVEEAKEIAERGIRGAIFTGTKDFAYEYSEKTMTNFRKANLPVLYEVTPEAGHEFLPDITGFINKAIEFITAK